MSVTGLPSDPNGPHKNSFHWRNNSGELDVFEAARYFSGANEHNNFAGETRLHGQRAACRMSLDMPAMRNPIDPDSFPMIQKQLKENNKKCKQPSSPGGRLASFLNSIFNQTASKKKKKSKSSTKDLEESPGGRKRRSSISHFRIAESDSVVPPAKTPTKSSYKEFQSFSDHRKGRSEANAGEEFRFCNGNVYDDEKRCRKFGDDDDGGADTDSSSDLFELPNCDLDLPVYGTTNVDRIRIGARGANYY